jgi:hypothetical protein
MSEVPLCWGGGGERERTGYDPFALRAPIQRAIVGDVIKRSVWGRRRTGNEDVNLAVHLCPDLHRGTSLLRNRHRIGPYPDLYRGTSLIRNRHPVGPYSRTLPRLLSRSRGGGGFL